MSSADKMGKTGSEWPCRLPIHWYTIFSDRWWPRVSHQLGKYGCCVNDSAQLFTLSPVRWCSYHTGLPNHQPPPFGTCLFAIVPGLQLHRRPSSSSKTFARIFYVDDKFIYFGKEKLNADGSWFLFVGTMPDYLPAGWVRATAVAVDDSSNSCG